MTDLIAGRGLDRRSPIAGGDLPCALGEPAHRAGHARRGPPSQGHPYQDSGGRENHPDGPQRCFQLHQFAARAADQKDAEQAVLIAGQGQCVERLGVDSGSDRAGDGGTPLLRLFDQRTDTQQVTGPSADQLRRREGGLQIAIEQRPHARRQDQAGEEALVQLLSAHNVNFAVARHHGADRNQGERHALLQLFPAEESAELTPVACASEPVLFVAETGGPLRGRDDGAVGRHQFQQVEPARGRQRGGLSIILRIVGRDRDIHRRFGIGNALDRPDYLLPAPVELLAELRDEGIHALGFHPFERGAGMGKHQQFDESDRAYHGYGENQEEACPEGHGRTPSSHRFSKRHSPNGVMPGPPLTRGPTPYTPGRWNSGIAR